MWYFLSNGADIGSLDHLFLEHMFIDIEFKRLAALIIGNRMKWHMYRAFISSKV